jgi:hypothetical protein
VIAKVDIFSLAENLTLFMQVVGQYVFSVYVEKCFSPEVPNVTRGIMARRQLKNTIDHEYRDWR